MGLGTGLAGSAMTVRSRVLKRYRELTLAARGRRVVARLEKLGDALVSHSPCEVFQGVDEELWLWLNTEGHRRSADVRSVIPQLPDEKTQMKLTGFSGDATLRVGHLLSTWFKQLYTEHAGSIASCRNILDFGCGWGRILRFFLKDLPPEKIWGVDVVPDFIKISRETNRWCHFEVVSPQPPSGLPAGTFDLIFCNSVFSHFSEKAHEQWLKEFRRLLSPGGLLIATTWPRQFIETRDQTIQDYPEWMRPAAAFLDKAKHFADYDSGRYCFSPVPERELAVLDTAEWGEACISKRYVVDRWTQYLEVVDFVDDASRYPQRGLYHQNVIVARRRA